MSVNGGAKGVKHDAKDAKDGAKHAKYFFFSRAAAALDGQPVRSSSRHDRSLRAVREREHERASELRCRDAARL